MLIAKKDISGLKDSKSRWESPGLDQCLVAMCERIFAGKVANDKESDGIEYFLTFQGFS
jgi:hypothetical protein